MEGFLSGAGGGHHRRRQGARRALRDSSDVGNHHRALFRQVDPELARSSHAGQPVGQRDPLGAAHAHVPAHHRVPVAGRPHRARDARRGSRRSAADARHLRRGRGRRDGDAGDQGQENAFREIRRRAAQLLDRGDDAERSRAAGRHQPRSGPEFRQGVRREVPEQGRPARLRVADQLGREHAADRRAGHEPFRRQRSGAAAQACAGEERAGPDLSEG